MNQRIIPLIILVLFFVQVEKLWCKNNEIRNDTIFVKVIGEEGIYTEITGNILELTSGHLLIKTTEGKRLFYTRNVVKRVVLEKPDPQSGENEKYLKWQELVNVYWNNEKSQFIAMVQNTPGAGPIFSFLDYLPGASGTFLAAFIILATLTYGAYRLYEMFVVATNLRNLNRTKLNMEVSKLQYEIESMKKQIGIAEKISPYKKESEDIYREPILYGFKLPQVHPVDFLKYKILQILTEDEKRQRTEFWHRKWQAYYKKIVWLPALNYYPRLLLNIFLTITAAVFSIVTFVDIFLPLVAPEEFTPFFSFVFLALFMISIFFFLRLNTQRQIMRKTYLDHITHNKTIK